ncbi:LysR family transcriptional regulator [Shimia aestuarii]|uniref:DNA-binding transcriptional regulator, LysR family n=1 Tax=Shimia aestuarii TaxID=254406 RepID=A0A1I4M0G8_9RHOB|nr:LysR family transcriptional regulator [Shimia aestuarii]SFL96898.1 DNA-binding transcriptional regulator, LysR family [Shimia aestuarii]
MNNRFRNWSDLRVFLSVARAGSTLAASRDLGMAQPTVARRIDALEHALGLTLFERDTRGFRLTPEGQSLLPAAEAVANTIAAFSDQAQAIAGPRPIRVTGFVANLEGAAARILSEFSGLYPDVQFEFLAVLNLLDLTANEADIALRVTWSEHDPSLICRHVSNPQFTLFGAPAYAEKYGLPRSPEEMAGHTVLSWKRDDTAPVLHDWICRHLPGNRASRSYSEVAVKDTAVRAGQGLGLMNVRLVAPEVEAGTLIRCFDPPEELTASHDILVAPDAWRRPEVKTFVRFFAPRYAALFR